MLEKVHIEKTGVLTRHFDDRLTCKQSRYIINNVGGLRSDAISFAQLTNLTKVFLNSLISGMENSLNSAYTD